MLKKIGNKYADKCQYEVDWMRKHPTLTGLCIVLSAAAAAASIASLVVEYYNDKKIEKIDIEKIDDVTFDEKDEEEF